MSEAVAAQTTETPATEPVEETGSDERSELREKLVKGLRKKRAAQELGKDGKAAPEKAPRVATKEAKEKATEQRPGVTKPKRGDGSGNREAKPENDTAKPDPKAKDAKPEGTEEQEGEDEASAFKKERKEFAKFRRKTERQFEARESQIATIEARQGQQVELWSKDPLAWLKSRGIDVRKTLIDLVNEDGEDPRDKKLREVEETTKQMKERLEREEGQRKQKQAQEHIRTVLHSEFSGTDAGDYPLLHTLSTPDRVARQALNLVVDHYKRTGEELAPDEVFRILERELNAHEAKRRTSTASAATTKAGGAPGQGPAGSAKREPVNPQPRRESRADDVTNSVSRRSSVSETGKSGLDKDALKERLTERVRAALR